MDANSAAGVNYDSLVKSLCRSHSGIDLIRADTIAKTDSSELTDAQRFAWYEFFDSGNGYKLQRSCIALWSEEITPENAGKRNGQYGINARGSTGCVHWVKTLLF